MINLEELSKLKNVAQVAEMFGRGRVCVMNWIHKGVVVCGERVKLQAVRVGGHWMIHPEQIEQFLREINPAEPVLPESPAAQQKRFEADTKRLADMFGGVL